MYFQLHKDRSAISFSRSDLIWGREYIIEKLLDLDIAIAAGTYFRINSLAAEVLSEAILQLSLVTMETTVLDLFCGSGSIALTLAKHCKEVIGIELLDQNTEDARRSARLNNIDNCTFIGGKLEDVLPDVLGHLGTEDVLIILDPPRTGMIPELVRMLKRFRHAHTIIYICSNHKLPIKNLLDFCFNDLENEPRTLAAAPNLPPTGMDHKESRNAKKNYSSLNRNRGIARNNDRIDDKESENAKKNDSSLNRDRGISRDNEIEPVKIGEQRALLSSGTSIGHKESRNTRKIDNNLNRDRGIARDNYIEPVEMEEKRGFIRNQSESEPDAFSKKVEHTLVSQGIRKREITVSDRREKDGDKTAVKNSQEMLQYTNKPNRHVGQPSKQMRDPSGTNNIRTGTSCLEQTKSHVKTEQSIRTEESWIKRKIDEIDKPDNCEDTQKRTRSQDIVIAQNSTRNQREFHGGNKRISSANEINEQKYSERSLNSERRQLEPLQTATETSNIDSFEPLLNKPASIESIIIPEHIIPVDLSPHTLRTELVILCRRYETDNNQEMSKSDKNKELSKRGTNNQEISERNNQEIVKRKSEEMPNIIGGQILNSRKYDRRHQEILKSGRNNLEMSNKERNNDESTGNIGKYGGNKQDISTNLLGHTISSNECWYTKETSSNVIKEKEELVENFVKPNRKPTETIGIVKHKTGVIQTGNNEHEHQVESADRNPRHLSTIQLYGSGVHKVVGNKNKAISAIGMKEDVKEGSINTTIGKIKHSGEMEEIDREILLHLENRRDVNVEIKKETIIQNEKQGSRKIEENAEKLGKLNENERDDEKSDFRSEKNMSKTSIEQKSQRYEPYQERRHVEKEINADQERHIIEKYLAKNEAQRSIDATETPEENDVLQQVTKEATILRFNLNQNIIQTTASMEPKTLAMNLEETKLNLTESNLQDLGKDTATNRTRPLQSEEGQTNVNELDHFLKPTEHVPKSNEINMDIGKGNRFSATSKDSSKSNQTHMDLEKMNQHSTTSKDGSKPNRNNIDIEELNRILTTCENGSKVVTSLQKEFEQRGLDGPELECVKYIHPDAVKEIETRAFVRGLIMGKVHSKLLEDLLKHI
uniref:tRNA (uracil(54)-C(5))-methyltransferase n=1 Tax=Cacopsylla melanoneura TaxID=428564 RepID=A0A8D8VT40_9HEMI